MTLEHYMLFVVAAVVLCVAPGPDMLFILARSIAQGRKAGLIAALGVNAGCYFHLTAALFGLSAILLTSSTAFTVVKWAGAVYLIYLGIVTFRSKGDALTTKDGGHRRRRGRSVFWQGFLSDVLNPKVAIFYLALLPQFVAPQSTNPISQLVQLGVTVNAIGLAVGVTVALLSARITTTLRRNHSVADCLTKAMGGVFVLLGLRLAAER